jgi:SAM-dependent methyltransferase
MLPDVEACLSLGAAAWGTLGDRLRSIGLTGRACQPFERLASMAERPQHAPMAKWHLRRLREPHAVAMRMLMYGDPVTPEEARSALGDGLPLDRLIEAGLLAKTLDGTLLSPYSLRLLGDVFVLSDDLNEGGEAVMGVGPSTRGLARIARPIGRVARALDVGCGAGTVALWLAGACDHVVATDVSARAVAFARVNAWLNRLTHVECRLGDLLAPVEGESFDLIVAQPPFVPQDDASPATTFLFGGPRGDELTVRLLAGIGAHLAPGGMGILLVEWPIIEGDPPLEERVRAAVGAAPDRSVLVMQWTDADVDEHCARYATIGHAWQDEAYERDAMRRREHFERLRIRSLRPTFTIVRRDREGAALGWTSTVQGRNLAEARPSREQIAAVIRARDLVAQGPDALRAATLRLHEGVTFTRRGEGGEGGEREREVEASFPGGGLCGPITMNVGTVRLVGFIEEAERVQAGIEDFAAAEGQSMDAIADAALEGVKFALLHGLLEVASS